MKHREKLHTVHTGLHTDFHVLACARAVFNNQRLMKRAHGAHGLYSYLTKYIHVIGVIGVIGGSMHCRNAHRDLPVFPCARVAVSLRKSLIINTPTRTRLKNTSNKEIFSGGFPDFKRRRRFPALFGGADTVSRVATAGRGCLYVQRQRHRQAVACTVHALVG